MMRSLLVASLFGVAAGCLRTAPTTLVTSAVRCPDPANCTQSNGTGVYYQEGGFAGIGPARMMITHFINPGSRVLFQGRWVDTAQHWHPLVESGQVYKADYRKHTSTGIVAMTNLAVIGVTEQGTLPEWTLQEDKNVPFPIRGPDLLDLTLYIAFSAPPLGQTQYVLDFVGPDAGDQRVHRYGLRWRALAGTAAPTPYCLDAQQAMDGAVFQRGIEVDPVDGRVTRTTPTDVTLSCSFGAPATVYGWGYDYAASADTFYFDAGIHMKRASYCGDAMFYTKPNTKIEIADDLPLGPNRVAIEAGRVPNLEAWWTPSGASCVNPDNLRHRAMGFGDSCGAGRLPTCQLPVGQPPPKFLLDGPQHPGP